MNARLYTVSLFSNRMNANRRQTWLDPTVLRQALDEDDPVAQWQVVLNVANSFRINPDKVVWGMLGFTILPLFNHAHYLGNE
jgi:hypothetical protein